MKEKHYEKPFQPQGQWNSAAYKRTKRFNPRTKHARLTRSSRYSGTSKGGLFVEKPSWKKPRSSTRSGGHNLRTNTMSIHVPSLTSLEGALLSQNRSGQRRLSPNHSSSFRDSHYAVKFSSSFHFTTAIIAYIGPVKSMGSDLVTGEARPEQAAVHDRYSATLVRPYLLPQEASRIREVPLHDNRNYH